MIYIIYCIIYHIPKKIIYNTIQDVEWLTAISLEADKDDAFPCINDQNFITYAPKYSISAYKISCHYIGILS